MKKFLLLFISIFAINIAASANEIMFLTLDITADGEKFSKTFTSSGEAVIDITSSPVQSIVINSALAFADGMNQVTLHAAVYRQGASAGDIEWHDVPLALTNNDNNTWTAEINQDIVNDDITDPCVLEFYLTGVYTVDDGGAMMDKQIYFNNDGQNYKVIYVAAGDDDWKVKFYKESTAGLIFNGTDGISYTFTYNGNASRSPSVQPDALRGFSLDEFAVRFIYYKEASVKVESVSVQYCLHEEGVPAASWTTVEALSLSEDDIYNNDKQVWEHRITATANKLDIHFDEVAPGVIIGFDPEKTYVLEIFFQVVADGKYFMLGKKNESSIFTWMSAFDPEPSENIINSFTASFIMDYGTLDWTPEASREMPIDLSKQDVKSLVVKGFMVDAGTTATSVSVCGTVYNEGKTSEEGWVEIPLSLSDDGVWSITNMDAALIDGYSDKVKVFEFYAKACDSNGTYSYFNNGGQNYKLIFTDKKSGGDADLAITYGDILLSYNDGEKIIGFGYTPDGQCEIITRDQVAPAVITSLGIYQTDMYITKKDGVPIDYVSLQFQVYPENSEATDSWNMCQLYKYDGGSYTRRGESNYVPLTTGFAPGVYFLEFYFQAVAGTDYYELAKGQTNAIIPFYISGSADDVTLPDIQTVIKKLGKRLEKGKVVIYYDGNKYNAAGELIP